MFAFNKSRMEIAIRVVLITVIVFNALVPTAALASAGGGSDKEAEQALPRALPEQKPVFYDPPQITYPQQTSPEPGKMKSPVPPKEQIEFTLTAEPGIVPANGLVRLQVNLRNYSRRELDSLVFTDALEAGLEYNPDAQSPVSYDAKKREVTYNLGTLGIGEEVSFSYSLTVTSSKRTAIKGKVWLHSAELTSSESHVNLKASVALGYGLSAAKAGSELVPLKPEGGWNDLGRVAVHMAKESVGANALVMSSPTKITGKGPALQFNLEVFETSSLAVDAASEFNEQTINLKKETKEKFKTPAFLEINLDGYIDLKNVPAGQEPYVATYDEEYKIWVKVPIVESDPENNSVTVQAAHFSTWGAGLGSSLPQNGANVLLFDQPYTSLFTGSARYSIPVWAPPGRGGMQPDISLSYSSGTVDGVLGDVQAPWVGVGWNIDDVEIVRKITTDENGYGYRDEYALTLNGSLYELVRDDFHPYRYFTDKAAFLYIERHNDPSGSPSTANTTGEWWEVVTTDGTRYRLGWNDDSEQLALMYGYSCTTVGSTCWPDGAYASLGYAGKAKDLVAMRWRVDRVSDTHGNYMEYGYEETSPDPSTTLAPFDRESYLKSIQYTGFDDPENVADLAPAYQVVFSYGNRSSIGDVPSEFNIWDNLDSKYLSEIKSCYKNCDATGSIVIRKYQFGYSLANVPNANGTLTLTSLQISGGGYIENGQSIPATSAPTIRFTYQDKDNRAAGNGNVFTYPRLAAIDNGSGGLLTFNYQHDGRGNNSWYNYRVQNVTVDSGMGLAKKQAYAYDTPVYSGQSGLGSLTGYTTVTESLLDFADNDAVILKTKHTFGTTGLDIGREMQTEVLDSADIVLRKTTNVYVTDNIGAPKDDNGNPLPNWNYRYLQESASYEKSGSTLTLISKNTYYNDPFTGNVLVQNTYLGNSLYRKTYYEYVTNPDPEYYILDKVSRVYLVSADNQVYSDTRYHYDGQIDQPPTHGDLTLVQRLTGSGNQTVDMVTDYNVYGNATSVKAYRNYGAVNTPPTAAYWGSTTTYDSVLNDPTQTYPMTVTNALNQSSSTEYLYTLGAAYQSTDPNGWTSSSTYDGLGRTLSVTPPGLAQPGTWYVYPAPDANGRISAPYSVEMQILDTIANKYRSVWGIYDGAGRMLQTQVDAGNKLLVNTTLFNALGLASQQSLPYEVEQAAGGNYIYDSGSQFTTMQYDVLGRAISVTAPGDITTQTAYDGLTTTVTDPNGNKVSRTTDGVGRLISVAEFSDASNVYATTTYFYDSADRLIRVKDAKFNTTTIQYDWLGRKLGMDDPDMGVWTYAYDSLGNMSSQTDARGQQLTFTYDALSRLTLKSDGDPNTVDSTYTYGTQPGTIGLRVGMTDASGSSSWSYANYGRTVTETRIIGGEQRSVTTNADWLGRPITTTYDDGEVVSYAYDELGRPDQLKSQPTGENQKTLVDLAYNVLGQIQTQSLGNGTVVTNTYDTSTTRLTNRKAVNNSVTQLDLSYVYDSNGNITRLTDNQLSETQFYDYDFLNRLTSAIGANGTPTTVPATPETYGQQFEYDKVGDIEQIDNWGTPPTQQQGRAPADGFDFVNYTAPQPQSADKALLAPAAPIPVYQEEPTATPTRTSTPTATNTPVPTNTSVGTSTPSQTPTLTSTPSPIPNNANTVALLHMDGTDAATTFTDQTGKTWTATENAQIDTAQFKFGTASGFFDGTGDYISTADSSDFAFGTGDFTVDFWVKFNALPPSGNYMPLFSQYQDSNSNWQYLYVYNSGSTYSLNYWVGSSGANIIYVNGGLSGLTTGVWYHFALVRSGTSFLMFKDGVQIASTVDNDSVPDYAGSFVIGAHSGKQFNGWLDEFRVSKGVARWTSSFTPPGSDYPYATLTPSATATYTPSATPTSVPRIDNSYSVSLLHMKGADASTVFVDESGKTWTRTGDAQIDTAQFKFGESSGLFDGNGDYISTADSADFAFGTGPFTVDFWIRFYALPGSGSIARIFGHGSSTNSSYQVYLSNTNGTYTWNFQNYGSGLNIAVSKDSPGLLANTWYHIALVRDGNNNFYIFQDGTQLGTTASDTDAMADASGVFYLGVSGNGFDSYLNGWIDEFRISKGIARWTANFTPPTQEYAPGTMQESLMAHWDFENVIPSPPNNLFAPEVAPNDFVENSAILQNGVAPVSDGANGIALRFDGQSGFASVADQLEIRKNSSFTISAWINPSAVVTYQTQYIVNKGVSATDFDYSFITTSTTGTATPTPPANVDTNGKLVFRVGDLTPNKVIGPVLPVDTWTLVTGVYDHANEELRLYVNGTLAATEKVTGTVNMGTGALNFSSATNPYYGKLDEVRFYNRALTNDEVAQLFGTFATPTPVPPSPTPVITPVGAGTYDDTNSAWRYSGTWTAWEGSGPYNNTSHYTGRVGNSAELTFTGTKFTLTYVKHPVYGLIDVYVDGVKINTINSYNSTVLYGQTYTSPTYSAGTHTVRLVYAGSGSYIDLDAIQIYDTAPTTVSAGTYDDADSAWRYSGAWTTWTGTGPLNETYSYTSTAGNFAELTFSGTRFVLTYVKAANRGLMDVYVDGIKIERINAYSASTLWKQTWTSPIFSTGTHTVRFVHAGGGTYANVDAIQIYDAPPAPVGVGTYDDTHSAWIYFGAWTAWTGTGPLNNTSHYTSGVGNFAELTFTGTKFTLTYTKAAGYGLIDVYVDGNKVDTINTYNASNLFQQTYTSPVYVTGTHTVRFVYAGGGTYIDLDAIQVFDTPDPTSTPYVIPVRAGIYDDMNIAWKYSGAWTAWSGAGPLNSSSHYTSGVGNFAELTFTGTKFTLTYTKAASYGLIDVYVDGAKVDTINTYNASNLFQQTYTSPVYSTGTHTVRFVHAGSGTYIDIDAIQIYDAPPTPVGVGAYDDTNNAWNYAGNWTVYSGSGPLNDTSHYTSGVGNFAELTFTGTKFTLTYTKAASYGLIDVYVDGAKIDTINTYNAGNLFQQTYTSPVFAAGTHTVRFTYAGSNTYIDIDSIQIFDAAPAAVGVGMYDDGIGNWIYSGAWTASTGSGPLNNTWHYTSTMGDYAEFQFNGAQFTLTYVKNSNRGLIDVYVDGTKIDTINANDASLTWQATWGSPVFDSGTHTVRLVHAGGGTYMDIDAIQIHPEPVTLLPGTYDDTNIGWRYNGNWVTYTGTGPYNSTYHYASTADDYAELQFNGTSFTLTYVKASNRGSIDVYVDGTKVTTINAYNATVLYNQTYTSPTYSQGSHRVRLVHAGGGTYIDVDAIQIFGSGQAGLQDDASSSWTYSGTWTAYTGSGPANNTLHYTSNAGNYAELTFNGVGFTLTYVKSTDRGLIDVYVDGIKVDTINAYSTSTLWQQTWTSQTYPAGNHTVRFAHAGGGTYIDVDTIQIYGAFSAPAIPQGWYASDYTYSTDIPHAVTSVNRGSFSDSFTYDLNGNMDCRTESGVTYKQTYNAENRIASIQKLASGTCAAPTLAAKWDFTYDGDGTRTAQSYTPYTDGQPGTPVFTRYYFGGAYETTGSAWKKYYSFAGQTVAMRDASGFKYFLSDHLGSVSVVLNDQGTILEQQRYLPFGQARVMPPYASVTSTDFTYTGQRDLSGTGVMDYDARFYSPWLGRFLQPDTIIPDLANPQSLNRFSYVLNNPVKYSDPSGHWWQIALAVVVIVVIIALVVVMVHNGPAQKQVPQGAPDYSGLNYHVPTPTGTQLPPTPTGTNCPIPQSCSWTPTQNPTQTKPPTLKPTETQQPTKTQQPELPVPGEPSATNCPIPMGCSWTPTPKLPATNTPTQTSTPTPIGSNSNYWSLLYKRRPPAMAPIKKIINRRVLRYEMM